MQNFWQKITSTSGDSTQQVIDLIIFLGYFSVCLYAGGIAYESSYNDYFSLTRTIDLKDTHLAIQFVVNVLATQSYWLLSSLYALLFIFIYYSCRYAWRPWLGYFVLSLLLYTTFLLCGFIGNNAGHHDATQDGLKEFTSRPVIKLYGLNHETMDFSEGSYHLLGKDENSFFVFEPAGEQGSILQIHAIAKSDIKHYEVIVK